MDIQKYVTHAAGIYTLLKALNYYERSIIKVDVKEQVIMLGYEFVDYYSFGSVKKRRGVKYPFIAFQEIEAKWVGLIDWDKLVIRPNDNHIYMISKVIKGDGENYADLPSFAIGLPLEDYATWEILKGCTKLDCREVFVSENPEDDVVIDFAKKLATLSLHISDKDIEEELSKESIVSIKEIITRKIEKTNIDYVPEYKGGSDYKIDKAFEHFFSKKKE